MSLSINSVVVERIISKIKKALLGKLTKNLLKITNNDRLSVTTTNTIHRYPKRKYHNEISQNVIHFLQ